MAEEEENKTTAQKSNTVRSNGNPSTKGIDDDQKDAYLKFRKEVYDSNRETVSESEEMLLKTHKLFNIREKAMRDLFNVKKASGGIGEGKKKVGDFSKPYTDVRLVRITPAALKQLDFGQGGGNKEDGEKKEKELTSLDRLMKLAMPVLMGMGAIIGSVKGMLEGGDLQGIFTVMTKAFSGITRMLANNFLKGFATFFKNGSFVRNIMAKVFGKGGVSKLIPKGKIGATLFKGIGTKFLKRIPIIGTLISVASGVKRITSGDYLQGMIDIASGIATLVPGVGTALSIGLDLLNASIDISKVTSGEGGGISGAVTGMQKWIGDNARNLPIIGPVVRVAEAIGYLVDGDVKAFFKGMMGAGFATIPGMSLVYDWLFGSSDPADQGTPKAEASGASKIGQGMKNIWDAISDWLGGVIGSAKEMAMEFISKHGGKLATPILSAFGWGKNLLKSAGEGIGNMINGDDSSGVKSVSSVPTVKNNKGRRGKRSEASPSDIIEALNRNTEATMANAEVSASSAMAVSNSSNSQVYNFNHSGSGNREFRNSARI